MERMKTLEQLFNDGRDLERQMHGLTSVVQNPGASFEDYMVFQQAASNFESQYREWRLQVTIRLSADISELRNDQD